jgi:membrane-associated phospholipid phosphatase
VTALASELSDTRPESRSRSRWWKEIAYILVLYAIYSFVRNAQGSVLSVEVAMRNAYDLVAFQERIGLISELDVQQLFLSQEWLIRSLNVFYGSAHFVVTIGVLIWLYRHQLERYVHWRNIIFATSALALIGYMLYPLAPPRLLPDHFGFVDTLATVGGLWSFESETVKNVSNQYAAMPSLHVAWSLWCALAVLPVLKHRVSRVLICGYPALVILTIVVTGNHYWMDVAGGAAVFGAGYGLATAIERYRLRRNLVHTAA